jgi:hypothetical protein
MEGKQHSPLPTSVRSAYPHSWEGATLVAPATRVAPDDWPALSRPAYRGAVALSPCVTRGQRLVITRIFHNPLNKNLEEKSWWLA